MNALATVYWQEYWGNEIAPTSVSAWQFGTDPDHLAQLVIDGVKTATCSGYTFYELENEPLPTTKDYNIILNSANEPVAITKTTEVTITPMNEVSEDFARAEGEGDNTYEYWWNEHEKFFSRELATIGKEFSDDMLLVCERFVLIDVKD